MTHPGDSNYGEEFVPGTVWTRVWESPNSEEHISIVLVIELMVEKGLLVGQAVGTNKQLDDGCVTTFFIETIRQYYTRLS